jgi:hypothetical protein
VSSQLFPFPEFGMERLSQHSAMGLLNDRQQGTVEEHIALVAFLQSGLKETDFFLFFYWVAFKVWRQQGIFCWNG